ncbi:MAG: DUF2779 domain-containing protein [Desulfobacteria bacterium]
MASVSNRLDFETFGSAIPLFDGIRAYQQVPFQYSLHRIDAEGGEVRHFEYLAQPGVDPRKEIAEKLPVLVPEMTYKGLEISDGAMASEAYFTLESLADPAELSRLRAALLEYCKQDTLGLVRLLEKMRAMEAADAKG